MQISTNFVGDPTQLSMDLTPKLNMPVELEGTTWLFGKLADWRLAESHSICVDMEGSQEDGLSWSSPVEEI